MEDYNSLVQERERLKGVLEKYKNMKHKPSYKQVMDNLDKCRQKIAAHCKKK